MALNIDEKRIRREMVLSLGMWGVGEDSELHRRFRKNAIDTAVRLFHSRDGDEINFHDLKKIRFPTDAADALRVVLKNEVEYFLESDTMVTFSDSLDAGGLEPRICRNLDNRYFTIKDEFKKFHSQDLDPFRRFRFQQRGPDRVLFNDWFLFDNESERLGSVFEALLASHAVHYIPCFSCKCRSLCWNGGYGGAWLDLVCVSCKSTYEIKSKEDPNKIQKNLNGSSVYGGNFGAFYDLYNSIPKSSKEAKMFLVLVSRNDTFSNLKKGYSYPVYIAEIEGVVPKLSPGSFRIDDTSKGIRSIKSRIHLKNETKAKWFDLPARKHDVDYMEIQEEVFVEHFSREVFDTFHAEYFYDSDEEDSKEPESNIIESAEGTANETDRTSNTSFPLTNLECDCWEDLASSDDEAIDVENSEEPVVDVGHEQETSSEIIEQDNSPTIRSLPRFKESENAIICETKNAQSDKSEISVSVVGQQAISSTVRSDVAGIEEKMEEIHLRDGSENSNFIAQADKQLKCLILHESSRVTEATSGTQRINHNRTDQTTSHGESKKSLVSTHKSRAMSSDLNSDPQSGEERIAGKEEETNKVYILPDDFKAAVIAFVYAAGNQGTTLTRLRKNFTRFNRWCNRNRISPIAVINSNLSRELDWREVSGTNKFFLRSPVFAMARDESFSTATELTDATTEKRALIKLETNPWPKSCPCKSGVSFQHCCGADIIKVWNKPCPCLIQSQRYKTCCGNLQRREIESGLMPGNLTVQITIDPTLLPRKAGVLSDGVTAVNVLKELATKYGREQWPFEQREIATILRAKNYRKQKDVKLIQDVWDKLRCLEENKWNMNMIWKLIG